MKVRFRGKSYELVFTEHAKAQMVLRNLDEATVLNVIENGTIKKNETKNRFWVFKSISGRKDNLISVAVVIESPHLIIITTMVNWRPR